MDKWLVIMRGLPGSGKSTYARSRWPSATVVSADDFFVDNRGVYRFDSAAIGRAHADCNVRAIRAMANRELVVVVDNTHSQAWEWGVVEAAALAFGYTIAVVKVTTGLSNAELAARCRHGVPVEVIAAMRERWEPVPDWYMSEIVSGVSRVEEVTP